MAGWQFANVSGESLSQANTYNGNCAITINGKTIETGTGTKSPTNPYTLSSVANFNLISTDTVSQTQTINFPRTLGNVPDGTYDYIEIDNSTEATTLRENTLEVIFNGTEAFSYFANANANNANNDGFIFNQVNGAVNITNRHFICSHFAYAGNASLTANVGIGLSSTMGAFYFIIGRELTGITSADNNTTRVNKFKAWLSAALAAGTPVKLQYKLVAPVITSLSYTAVKQYYPQTQIYTTAAVQPTLNGKFRIFNTL